MAYLFEFVRIGFHMFLYIKSRFEQTGFKSYSFVSGKAVIG